MPVDQSKKRGVYRHFFQTTSETEMELYKEKQTLYPRYIKKWPKKDREKTDDSHREFSVFAILKKPHEMAFFFKIGPAKTAISEVEDHIFLRKNKTELQKVRISVGA